MQRYLSKCHYDEEREPYCPNFRLGFIAEQARENFSELCRTVSVTLQCVQMFKFIRLSLPMAENCLIIHISLYVLFLNYEYCVSEVM